MAIKFVSIGLPIVLFVVVNGSPLSILFDITQCISYRYVSCKDGFLENVKAIIDPNEEVIKFNKTDCISYQFIPCRDGWKSLTIVYQNLSKSEKQTNCEANGKLENAAEELMKTLEWKNDCENNLTNCRNGRNYCDVTLTTCNEKIFNCSSEKKILQASFAQCQNGRNDCDAALNNCENEKKNTDFLLGDEKTKFQRMNSTLNEKIFNCSVEMNLGQVSFTNCQNGRNDCDLTLINCNEKIANYSAENNLCQANFIDCHNKETNCEERYNKVVKEKKILSAYMATFFTGTTIDELNEKMTFSIKDRMVNYIRYSAARLGLSELKPPNITQLIPEYGPVYNDILSIQYPINIPADEPLSVQQSPYATLFVAVTGLASDNNQKRRDQIRKQFKNEIKNLTAGKSQKFYWIKFAFFLGRTENAMIQSQIEQESETYKDIVQIDMIDSAGNSSLKMVAVFNWVRLNCANVQIFFKADENLENLTLWNLAAFLDAVDLTENYIYGLKPSYPKETMYSVVQDGKRRISEEEYPWTKFLEYINGTAYYVTGNMIVPLLATFQTMPMISLDDVYLGLCTLKAKMKFFPYCGNKGIACF